MATRKKIMTSSGATVIPSNCVAIVDANGDLIGDADLTFATDTLTATKLNAPTSITTPLINASNSPADLSIACGTDKTIVLSETVWKDVFFPMGTPKTTGVGTPNYVNWIGNLYNYSFPVDAIHNFDPQEFPHDGKQGATTCSLHLHWISRTNVAAERKVKWEVEFTQSNINGVYPATTTPTATEVTIAASTTANTHYLTTLHTFTALNIGSMLCIRLKRIASSGTEPADDPVVLGVHYHYEVDTIGSRQETTK